jgi:hypothetical protein
MRISIPGYINPEAPTPYYERTHPVWPVGLFEDGAATRTPDPQGRSPMA